MQETERNAGSLQCDHTHTHTHPCGGTLEAQSFSTCLLGSLLAYESASSP